MTLIKKITPESHLTNSYIDLQKSMHLIGSEADDLDKANCYLKAYYVLISSINVCANEKERINTAEKAKKILGLALSHQQKYREENPLLSEEELLGQILDKTEIYSN